MPKFSVRKRTQEMLSNLSFLDLQRMARNQEITPRDEIREDGKKFWQLASTIDGLNFEPIPKFSLRKPDGKVISGAKAFVVIWSKIPKYKFLSKLFSIKFFFIIFHYAYEFVAYFLFLKNRKQLK